MKFDTLYQSLLEAKKPDQQPYDMEGENLRWTRKGGNLEGAPESVGGFFNCAHNQLKNLVGAPEKMGGAFYCWNNPLRSLEGIPEAGRGYNLPLKFTMKDVRKEIEHRKIMKGLDPKTTEVFDDFLKNL